MTDLGTLGGDFSRGLQINNSGQVIGYSVTADHVGRPFLYSNGVMQDLNNLIDPALGITLYAYPGGINDRGQTGSFGTAADGGPLSALLTPITAPSVPEPASVALCAVGLLGIAFRQRYRRW